MALAVTSEFQVGSKKKEEGEVVKGKGESGRKKLRGKEGYVKRYMPNQSAYLLSHSSRHTILLNFQCSGNLASARLYLIYQNIIRLLLSIKELGNVFCF